MSFINGWWLEIKTTVPLNRNNITTVQLYCTAQYFLDFKDERICLHVSHVIVLQLSDKRHLDLGKNHYGIKYKYEGISHELDV